MQVHDLNIDDVSLLSKVFEMFDSNNSNEIDFNEFCNILKCIEVNFSHAEKLFKFFDKNNDGKINKEEF